MPYIFTHRNAAINQAPIGSAGIDQVLTLPTNTATLTATASDADGTIVNYAWTQVSGPNTATIDSPNTASTGIGGMVEGTYVFQVTVTDDQGATGTDDITITVNAAPNETPTVSAGTDIGIQAPTNSTTLTATANDTDGTIASYMWTQVSGRTADIISPTAQTTDIQTLRKGVSEFRIEVTDNAGAIASDTIQITVYPELNDLFIGSERVFGVAGAEKVDVSAFDGGGNRIPLNPAWTFAWSVSPNEGTFADTTAQTTTITGLTIGNTYTFTCIVTDENGTTKSLTHGIVKN